MEKIRIFLTDDNDEIRAALHKYLEAQEDMIISGEAANGVEALQRLPECPSDVIILDLIMPQMDGYAVLERLQAMKLSKQPGVIALTALGRDDFISRAVNLGVNYYMVKPFDFMMLAQRVYEAAGESLRRRTGTKSRQAAASKSSSSASPPITMLPVTAIHGQASTTRLTTVPVRSA